MRRIILAALLCASPGLAMAQTASVDGALNRSAVFGIGGASVRANGPGYAISEALTDVLARTGAVAGEQFSVGNGQTLARTFAEGAGFGTASGNFGFDAQRIAGYGNNFTPQTFGTFGSFGR